jgi:hypothetical protein
MSDFDAGAAPAAAESTAAPVATPEVAQVIDTPNPVSTHSEPKPKEEPKPVEEKKPLTPRESLQKAAEKVKAEAAEAEAKAKAKEPADKEESGKEAPKPVKSEPAKAEEKKPAEKQPAAEKQEPVNSEPKAQPTEQQAAEQPKAASKYTPPERFSPDAKTAWETAPEPVKAEVHRAIRELEQGHQKYKADAEAYSEIREYDQLAKQVGTSVKDALSRYTGLEKRLTSSDENIKAQAVAEVLQYAGLNPRQYAAYISGQTPDEVQTQHDTTISTLQREIAALKQQVGGVTTTIQDQRTNALMSDIAKFADAHPRFDEHGETIAKLISTGMAADISEAYDMAERLNPAPVQVQTQTQPAPVVAPVPDTTKDDLKAQTLKGSKSVAGAPTPGSNPGGKGNPSSSIREALKRAAAAAG